MNELKKIYCILLIIICYEEAKNMDKRIIFVRHGQSEGQVASKMGISRKDESLLDCPITHRGRDQAFILGKTLRNIDPAETKILCSPLTRALQTALIAFPEIPIQVHQDLMERGNIPENSPRSYKHLSRDPNLNLLPGWENINWSEIPESWPHEDKIVNRKKDKKNAPKIEKNKNQEISGKKSSLLVHRKKGRKSRREIEDEKNQNILEIISSLRTQTVIVVCHFNVINSLIPQLDYSVENCRPIETILKTSVDESGNKFFYADPQV